MKKQDVLVQVHKKDAVNSHIGTNKQTLQAAAACHHLW